jgi:hypothetical protein
MGLSQDWREFLELLNSRRVDYVIVGAHRLALHGRPRYTGDLVFWCDPRLKTLGRAPTRIDLLTSISGVSSEEALPAKFRQNSMASRFLKG